MTCADMGNLDSVLLKKSKLTKPRKENSVETAVLLGKVVVAAGILVHMSKLVIARLNELDTTFSHRT